MLNRRFLLFAAGIAQLFFTTSFSQQNAAHSSSPTRVVLSHVSVINVNDGTIEKNRTVVLEGNKIKQITTGNVRVADAITLNARGKFLLPGFWDMHVHFSAMPENLKLFIANGVTGVRDMGSILLEKRTDAPVFLSQQMMLDSILTVRRWVDEGRLTGPRIMTAGLALNGPLPRQTPVVTPFQRVVTDSNSAKAAVNEMARRRVGFIKVHALLSREAYYAIAKEAKRLRVPFAGHLPNVLTPVEASRAGQSSIEHLTGIPEYINGYRTMPRDPLSVQLRAQEVYTVFKQNNTWQTPTLTSYLGYETAPKLYHGKSRDDRQQYVAGSIQQFWRYYWPPSMFKEESNGKFFHMLVQTTAALHKAGVGILAGTDFAGPFVYPGFSLHDELRLLHDSAGLSNLSALQAATLNPAKYFGLTTQFGTVEEGKVADLVLLDDNPLVNINNTRKIFAVIANGRVFDKKAIAGLLREGKQQRN